MQQPTQDAYETEEVKEQSQQFEALEFRLAELSLKIRPNLRTENFEQAKSNRKNETRFKTIEEQKDAIEKSRQRLFKLEEKYLELISQQILQDLHATKTNLKRYDQDSKRTTEMEKLDAVIYFLNRSCKVIKGANDHIKNLSDLCQDAKYQLDRYRELGTTTALTQMKERLQTLQALANAKDDIKTQGTYEDLKKMLDQI